VGGQVPGKEPCDGNLYIAGQVVGVRSEIRWRGQHRRGERVGKWCCMCLLGCLTGGLGRMSFKSGEGTEGWSNS